MLRFIKRILVSSMLLIYMLTSSVASSELKSGPLQAVNAKAKKFRIAYCEYSPYGNYASTLYSLIRGLAQLGWVSDVEKLPYTIDQEDSKSMWQWLATHSVSSDIEFVSDGHYTLNSNNEVKSKIIKRLNEKKDIDLVITMGTLAGKFLAENENKIPILIFSTSNAVESGIIKSEFDSGKDNIWAHMDLNRFKRQVEVFHDIFSFKKLGLIYEDSEAGRSFAALKDVNKVAVERGFEVVSCYVKEPETEKEREQYYEAVLEANRKLSKEVDAIYLTAASIEAKRLPKLLEPYYKNKIPVFSQIGELEVKYGALLSVSQADFSGSGKFGAETIIKVLNGAMPRQLPQIYEDTPHIVLNLEVANKINYKPRFEILMIADKIYQSIENK